MSIIVAADCKTGMVEAWVRGARIVLSREEAALLAAHLGQALKERRVDYAEITRSRNPFGPPTIPKMSEELNGQSPV